MLQPDDERTTIGVIAYSADEIVERPDVAIEEVPGFLEKWPVTWICVQTLGDAAAMVRLGEIFRIHPLALEDVANALQRPKVEQYPNHHFIVMRMVELGDRLRTEQLSIFLGSNYILTFLEDPGDSFDLVRERLRTKRGRIRSSGTDYLAYALIDAVIDAYFPVLEKLGERLDNLEEDILARPAPRLIPEVHAIKRDLLTLRRVIWPQREAVMNLIRDAGTLIKPETVLYLRDCYDHAVRIQDMVETSRELGSDLMDLYLSRSSQRMNEIMKVLTIITTIFMPLSFIAGVYGMNFDPLASHWNMPELHWRFGYPFALGLMLVSGLVMLYFFWRRGWLGGAEKHEPGDRER